MADHAGLISATISDIRIYRRLSRKVARVLKIRDRGLVRG